MAEKYVAKSELDSALEELCNKYNVSYGEESMGFGRELAELSVQLPSANVALVVHGHWEETEEKVWDDKEGCLIPLIKCSVCSMREREDEDTPYCRTCGAKMDGGDENA